MILFTILLVTLIVLVGAAVLMLGIGGAVCIIPFADVIVCIIAIVFIMRALLKKRKKRKK